jgi:hypothetical protein
MTNEMAAPQRTLPRLHSSGGCQGDRPDPARLRPRSRPGHSRGWARSAPLRRWHQRHLTRGSGPAADPVRGPHALPAFRASGRPARHDPVPWRDRAPDAALAHCRRCLARPRVEPEHSGPDGGPVPGEPRRHSPADVCDLPGREQERDAHPRRSPGCDNQHSAALAGNRVRFCCPGTPRRSRRRIGSISEPRRGSIRRAPALSSRPMIWICGLPGPIR